MAETGWRRISHFASGEVQANEYFDNITRTNNNLRVNGLRSQWRVTVSGSDSNVWTRTYFNGVERNYTHYGNPSWSAWNIRYGNQAWFDVGVGANDTSAYTSTSWGDYTGAWNNGDAWFSIPALGSPTGVSASASLITKDTARLNASVASWGANATVGNGARLEYKKASSSSWTNLAYNDPGSHSRNVTGLTPNTRYNVRTFAHNGGGKSTTSSVANFDTLSAVYELGSTEVLATTVKFIDMRVYQGQHTTTSKVEYRKKGDTTWLSSESKTGDNITIEITGLLPNTIYERRFVATTSAGTTTNDVAEFTTLPAGKLIYPDGTVKNAIPRLVRPDGTPAEMININLVRDDV